MPANLNPLPIGLLSLLLLLISSPIQAHGPAPAPLRVFGVTPGGAPDVVTTSMGLTWHDGDDGYTYGCPSQWGSSELTTPLVEVLDQDTLMVVGSDALYTSTSRACPISPLTNPDAPAPSRIADLHPAFGRVWGVANVLSGSSSSNQTWAWSPAEGFQTAFRMEERKLDSILHHGDTLFIAGARPDPVLIRLSNTTRLPIDASAMTVTPLNLPTDASIQRLSLRQIDEGTDGALRLWMVGTWGAELHLVRSDDGGATWTELGTAMTAIHGPVPLCGGMLAVADGELLPDPDNAPSCSLEPLESRMFACLQESAGEVYFCELRQLKRIVQPEEDTGELDVETWYRLEQITGPDVSCVEGGDGAVLACEQDWLHEAAEAGLVTNFGMDEPSDAEPSDEELEESMVEPKEDDSGCAIGVGRSWGVGWLFMGVVLIARRRRRGTI